MKKSILFIVAMSLLTFGFTSCEKQSLGKTSTVDYVVLKLLGDPQVKLGLGDTYEEAGWTATDKGQDVHDSVDVVIVDMMGDVVDSVSTDIPGIFTITYSVTSQDGMFIEETRQVLVFDAGLTMSLKGAFAVDFDKSERIDGTKDWTWTQWSAMYTDPDQWSYADYSMKAIDINFKELVPGIYEVDDLLGGFYMGLRGYGPLYKEAYGASYYYYYAMGGMVVLNADGSLDLVSSHIDSWGDALTDFSGTYDDGTKTLDIHSEYGNMDFHVVMVKK